MIRAIALLLALALPAAAQDYPAPLSPTVSDFAGILDADTEARLTATLTAARDDPGTEIALVTIRSRADYGPSSSIEAFATGLFNAWGIGDPARNNGILILVALDDREMRLELGAGYPPVWDQVAENVIDNTFLPRFREDDYPGGITRGTDAVIDRIARPFALNTPPETSRSWREWLTDTPLLPLLIAGGIVAFGARRRLGDWVTRLRRCPRCGRRRLTRERVTLDPASKDTGPGTGEEITECRNCHWEDRRRYAIPVRTSGGGSGFSGGRSSGGGASGRW